MSRHWSGREYINAEVLWSFIDEQTSRLDLLVQHDEVESSELCKLFILGRREMLDAVCTFLHGNEVTLQEIVIDQGVLTNDEVNRIKKEEYGI